MVYGLVKHCFNHTTPICAGDPHLCPYPHLHFLMVFPQQRVAEILNVHHKQHYVLL